MGMQKLIAAVVGGVISFAAVYGFDLGPGADVLISVLTAASVWFVANK